MQTTQKVNNQVVDHAPEAALIDNEASSKLTNKLYEMITSISPSDAGVQKFHTENPKPPPAAAQAQKFFKENPKSSD
jgi:hypothetical protein